MTLPYSDNRLNPKFFHIYDLPTLNPGLFGGQGDEVAFHGIGQGGDAGRRFAVQVVQEVGDQHVVAACVAGHPLPFLVEVPDLRLLAEEGHGDRVFCHVGNDLHGFP